MKPFSIVNDKEVTDVHYKALNDLGFDDLYVDIPEQNFAYVKTVVARSIKWLPHIAGAFYKLTSIH